MQNRKKLSDNISAGGQPSADNLRSLAGEGYRSIVNLRRDGEKDQPLTPEAEGEAAREAGLDYRHIPVNPAAPTDEDVAAFKAAIADLPGPVYVHCAAGGRACTLSLIAENDGKDASALLDDAAGKGVNIPDGALKDLLTRHAK